MKEIEKISTVNLIKMLDKIENDDELKLPICFELSKRISIDNDSFFKCFIELYGNIHKTNEKTKIK